MPTPRPATNHIRAFGVAACLALVAVACGDDDESTASAEYCVLATELDEQEDLPTTEQLEALRDAGPEEISEELDVVVGAFIAADGDFGKAFADPAVEENLGTIEAYEADVCGLGDDEEAEGEDEPETEPIDGAQVISVTGVDFAFEGIPAEIPAGPTSFEFTNEGEAAHEMAVFKLGEGVELDALLAAEQEPRMRRPRRSCSPSPRPARAGCTSTPRICSPAPTPWSASSPAPRASPTTTWA